MILERPFVDVFLEQSETLFYYVFNYMCTLISINIVFSVVIRKID